MARTPGAKNKNKTDEELLKELNQRGYEFDKLVKKDIEVVEPLEKLEIAKPEVKYKCGNCGSLFASKQSQCPACGVGLLWQ